MTPKFKRRSAIFLGVAAVVIGSCTCYVKTHPLVFNESFLGHAHCLKGGGLALLVYAQEHGGRFPFHTNGYGDALVLVNDDWDEALTGPGYDAQVFQRVRATGENAPEGEFGRVYVQGLSITNGPEIAILFDKLPTPGGDHCSGFRRLTAPFGREVATLDGHMQFVRESNWSVYSQKQIELLVAAGMERGQAETYYSAEVRK